MTDLEIIMKHTGWDRETAQSATDQWRKQQPDWDAQYVLVYLRPIAVRRVDEDEDDGEVF